jgi:transposase InsO family protein
MSIGAWILFPTPSSTGAGSGRRESPVIEVGTSITGKRVVEVLEQLKKTFNGKLREECLDLHWFSSLEDAKINIEAWRKDYNEQRPHSALRQETPRAFAAG